MTAPRYKSSPQGTNAQDTLFVYVRVQDVDVQNNIAHVIDQLGKPFIVSTTRSYGKQYALPAPQEEWIVGRQFGDWIFVVNVSANLAPGLVPKGGTSGQVLAKNSNADEDLKWENIVGLVPVGGTTGQVLSKNSNSDEDVAWASLPAPTPPIPSGMISMWATAVAPTGYLLCDGSAVSRTTYSALFAAIGATFGAGDGTTTFNLPDFRGRYPAGKDGGTLFTSIGKTLGTLAHSHPLSDLGQAAITMGGNPAVVSMRRIATNAWTALVSTTTSTTTAPISTSTTTGAGLLGNTDAIASGGALPPTLTINFIIKV